MEIAMIGLGKMGMGIAENLLRHQHQVKGFDIDPSVAKAVQEIGGSFHFDIESLLAEQTKQQIVWLMLPAGILTNNMVMTVADLLNEGDIVIEAGNSHYQDSLKNFDYCQQRGVHFIDVGTSGGVEGARNGACMMIGGDQQIFAELEPLFTDLCVDKGFIHSGPAGSGHYLKMVHNGIEYGMMQSIGEGFNLLHHSPYDFQLAEVAQVFNHGSVIRSWLMELTEKIYQQPEEMTEIAGVIPSSGEGKWTVEEALRLKVNLPVITQSLMTRFASEDCDKISEKLVALLRNQFGGHAIVKDE
ncbi:decarboxylating 6-phosphogluconate dehydrogenase [Enterococcus hulanensis]|uniref:Decarboxylating 6-phosphogluconate dehydrogenase n=1 Tax=Enterococcus hulanensis TaxID=2559929 RepID=A0ABU3F4Y1_9ENTE|nr:decarboxylating 6-phosphogluconate dehydrogenase [Enterococcus hulanensis]MDT2602186.1 decarboxylating 6-phosphogluconate dehydrogenase [Enterococcus hulanensis]MDT2611581.1 decarboxylating 6-phosphogluconate dehydrogenase [Enterococcus hulanensis]MDT2618840.1 decarboxylating 6-phosphogluconate dehydrogenase [Enterococcus hulanensis]MDT2630258.1 decarboxylating 6-phosphogluconate dehydrogenase [Enterococcus hulanensis]MDT2657829.1 decarboxylating 6-phosphogluconate dehydrogenase [Enterococc